MDPLVVTGRLGEGVDLLLLDGEPVAGAEAGRPVRRRRSSDIVLVDGRRATTAVRTAWDLCRRLSLVEAVVALDALARCCRFAPSELLTRRAAQPGARGCRRLDRVVALADPRAESPMESRLRLQIVLAGLPAPQVQYRVHDEYGFVLARVDLAYPSAKLALEYDGSTHYDRRHGERDRRRDTVLAGYGWLTLRIWRHQIGVADTVRLIDDIRTERTPPQPRQPRQPRSPAATVAELNISLVPAMIEQCGVQLADGAPGARTPAPALACDVAHELGWSGRRRRVGTVPAGTGRVLLPDARLGDGGRGRRAGDAELHDLPGFAARNPLDDLD